MALSEEQVQKRRDRNEELRRQLDELERERLAIEQQADLQASADRLDAEAEELKRRIAQAKAINKRAAKQDAGPVEATAEVLIAPAAPGAFTTVAEDTKSDTKSGDAEGK